MLNGKVALVTGASRGIGRGIALQLGAAGATVYITGRSPGKSDNKDGTVPQYPTLEKVAREVNERGGTCKVIYCDHSSEEEIEKLFEQIDKEQNGALDILVNNAFSAGNALKQSWGKKFWDESPLIWDEVNNVGLRNHYICSTFGARMMAKRRKGLIVIVSSAGGLKYLFNVAYGVGKAACDRMAADMAMELKSHNIACVSLWPGAVKTEMAEMVVDQLKKEDPAEFKAPMEGLTKEDMLETVERGETTEYAGKCVVHLAMDPHILGKSGKILLSADLGDEYGFKDVAGNKPENMRSVKFVLNYYKWKKLAKCVPQGVKVPKSILAKESSHF